MKTGTIFRSVTEWKDDAGVAEEMPGSVARRVSDRPPVPGPDEQTQELDAELCAAGCDRHPEMYIG